MCGLLAIYSQQHDITEPQLHHALHTLHHRGPDQHHTWVSANKNIGLGHTRLSIIDLAKGKQPLSNQSKNIHLIVNGEFYDFENQRKQLIKKGHHFLTHSDSEIALHLYEDYGTHALQYLRGEFAFVLWDETNRTLFAARDRFGIKPLFYTVYNGKLLLASEIKALIAAGVKAEWDADSFKLFCASTVNLANRTLFKNIYQIPPAHYLIALDGQIQLYKYWDFDYPESSLDIPTLSENEYIDALKIELDKAVKLRLRADVPVACYLSGGLDSSVVLGLAASHAANPIPAFTLSFNEAAYDEYNVAHEMAKKAGAIFNPISINESDLAIHFSDAIWHGETFFYNGHGVAKYLLSQAVRDAGFKVVLTGEGSDELFAGYPHFRIDHVLQSLNNRDKEKLINQVKHTNQISEGLLLPKESRDIPSITNLIGFTPTWLQVAFESGVKIDSVMNEAYRIHDTQFDSFKILFNSLDVFGQIVKRDPINQSLYLWSKTRLPDYILTILGDRMEMAHSIEGRLPFLDHKVVEFMRKVPVKLKINDMTEKYLLREAASHVLTKTVYKREKHPFLAPPALLDKKSPFYELIQSTLRSHAFKAIPFFNQKKVINVLDKLSTTDRREATAWDPVLMVILSAAIMQERFHITA